VCKFLLLYLALPAWSECEFSPASSMDLGTPELAPKPGSLLDSCLPPLTVVNVPPLAAADLPPLAAVEGPLLAAVDVPPLAAADLPPLAVVEGPPLSRVNEPPLASVAWSWCR
jgi:hypothetical protein